MPGVRNLLSIGNKKPIPIYVWIPPSYDPIFKIEVTDSEGNNYDVTDLIIEGEYTDGITDTIGNFNFKIDNSTQSYNNIFNPYNIINIYLDYGTTATTKRFSGYLERVSKQEHNLVLTGRNLSAKYVGKNITYSDINAARSLILSKILLRYFDADGDPDLNDPDAFYTGTEISQVNLESDTGTMTVNYFDKPFWEVVSEICQAGNYDAYINVNGDFNYFSSGSRLNTTEAVVHEYNLISTGDFAPDAQSVYNKIKVYGADIGGIPVIYTASDTTSQASYGVKELKIEDSSITTTEQAQARADYELSINKDPVTIGEVTSLGLPTIAPGQMIRISDPLNGLNPTYYKIQKFTHKFSNDEPFQTTLTLYKERTSIPNILKKRIKFESEVTANKNQYELDYSHIFDFQEDSGSHTNTQISINSSTGAGELKTDGSASGTWISDTITLTSNIIGIEPRIEGNNLSGVQIAISTDAGVVFHPIVSGTSTIPSGKYIQMKIILNSASTIINGVGFLYSI